MKKMLKRWSSILVLTGLAGCSQLTYSPAADHNTLETTEFMHSLTQQPMVNYDQACRVVLLMSDGQDTPRTFDERSAELASRGVVRSEWNLKSEDAVDRGTFAYMIYRTARMPGGINTRLSNMSGFGDRRYALKEVVRNHVMPYGLPYQIPTGGEVVMAVAKADDYMAKTGVYESTDREINSPADVRGGAGGS